MFGAASVETHVLEVARLGDGGAPQRDDVGAVSLARGAPAPASTGLHRLGTPKVFDINLYGGALRFDRDRSQAALCQQAGQDPGHVQEWDCLHGKDEYH